MINIKRNKWMIVDDQGQFLSNKGFKKFSCSNACPRLFQSILQATKYISRDRYADHKGIQFIEVEVEIIEKAKE